MQFREDQKNTRKLQKIIFSQKTKDARRGGGVGPQGAHTPPQARATLGHAYRGCATLALLWLCPLTYIFSSKP